jgi:hypothetical protein
MPCGHHWTEGCGGFCGLWTAVRGLWSVACSPLEPRSKPRDVRIVYVGSKMVTDLPVKSVGTSVEKKQPNVRLKNSYLLPEANLAEGCR